MSTTVDNDRMSTISDMLSLHITASDFRRLESALPTPMKIQNHFLAGRIITLLVAGLFTGVVAVLPRVMNPVPKVVWWSLRRHPLS